MGQPDLHRAVDDVLEAAWPTERRRAVLHLVASTLGRAGVFLLALLAMGLTVRLVFGFVVPWTFYAFMGDLVLVCSRPGPEESAHLRRGMDDGPSHKPSTGCYPRTPLD